MPDKTVSSTTESKDASKEVSAKAKICSAHELAGLLSRATAVICVDIQNGGYWWLKLNLSENWIASSYNWEYDGRDLDWGNPNFLDILAANVPKKKRH